MKDVRDVRALRLPRSDMMADRRSAKESLARTHIMVCEEASFLFVAKRDVSFPSHAVDKLTGPGGYGAIGRWD